LFTASVFRGTRVPDDGDHDGDRDGNPWLRGSAQHQLPDHHGRNGWRVHGLKRRHAIGPSRRVAQPLVLDWSKQETPNGETSQPILVEFGDGDIDWTVNVSSFPDFSATKSLCSGHFKSSSLQVFKSSSLQVFNVFKSSSLQRHL
jgi:hypothetical protein